MSIGQWFPYVLVATMFGTGIIVAVASFFLKFTWARIVIAVASVTLTVTSVAFYLLSIGYIKVV